MYGIGHKTCGIKLIDQLKGLYKEEIMAHLKCLRQWKKRGLSTKFGSLNSFTTKNLMVLVNTFFFIVSTLFICSLCLF